MSKTFFVYEGAMRTHAEICMDVSLILVLFEFVYFGKRAHSAICQSRSPETSFELLRQLGITSLIRSSLWKEVNEVSILVLT